MRVRLFGGTKDGEWLQVDPGVQNLRVAILSEIRFEPSPDPITPDMEYETYNRLRLFGDSRRFEVFCPAGWTGDHLLAHLIDR